MDYFREVANSAKFQLSATISFGTALYLILVDGSEIVRILLTILFLFPACMFVISLCEKIFYYIYKLRKMNKDWNNLTPKEEEFLSFYIKNNTRTKYVEVVYGGAYEDSGTIDILCRKRIIYRASERAEQRPNQLCGDYSFPFNIYDKAFLFFKKKLND